ncbi:tRNA/rRNA methyltransferase (SpoU) [Enhygromyxa salina]|uniref:tRNA/rRNA methyltransferase (SpoU) n=1 Tax=Enhygromyxa salina TaxID=215803 RepID=A0A0C1ZXX9_9BACT|nr:RNA methyltransferase [Enhygromyxa salina]KIG16108.1 tRNA/rRNA methyltransferase (SpoU) [Enhygromyxa salina]
MSVLEDPRLRPYRDLQGRIAKPDPDRFLDRFIVEGALAVERLLATRGPAAQALGVAALEVESVVCTPSQRARLALPAALPVIELSKPQLSELAGFAFHRGVLACARRPAAQRELDPETLARLRGRERVTIVVAEGLADPRNLGALVRNVAAFSADLLIADARGADLYSRLAIRASVGNVFRVPCLVSDALPSTIVALARELCAKIIAATPEPTAALVHQFEPPAKQILLVGNEGAGLSPELLACADHRVRIPVADGSDSLNVAAATAVLLFALSARS